MTAAVSTYRKSISVERCEKEYFKAVEFNSRQVNRRGAPVKNNHCDPKIHNTLKEISNGTLKPPLDKKQNEEFPYPKTVNFSITINPATFTEEQKKKLTAFILSL